MDKYLTSLLNKIQVEEDPIKKIDLENDYAFELWDYESERSVQLSYDIIEKCKALVNGPYEKGIASAFGNIGMKLIIKGELERGYKYLEDALAIYQRLNLDFGQNYVKMLMANYYWGKGDITKGMELAIEVSERMSQFDEPLSNGWCNYFTGTFYADLKEFDLALTHLNKSKLLFNSVDHQKGLARVYNSLTSINRSMGKTDIAIDYALSALEINRETLSYVGLSRALNDLGGLYSDKGEYEKAIASLNQSLEIRRKSKNIQAIITTLTELAETYFKLQDYEKCLLFYTEAREQAVTISAKNKLVKVLLGLIEVYKALQQPEKALAIYDEVYVLRSEVLSHDSASRIKGIEDKFALERKAKEAEINRLKNVELKQAYSIIEEKNKDITDSILYAQRIQQAILPERKYVLSVFPGSFILFKPKDIVSGDFYWAAEKDNLKIVAVIDCTGHGVPGAFMSMLGYSLLNEIILGKGILEPGLILKELSKGIKQALKQTGESAQSKDGMDLTIVTIKAGEDSQTKTISFAGANNPLWLVEDVGNTKQLREVKGDKKPVGFHFVDDEDYKTHTLELKSGTSIYLFTDGFADQFGGEKGKKFKAKKMKELVLSIQTTNMNQQGELLNEAFDSWKGNLEQVDDVCVVGIKL